MPIVEVLKSFHFLMNFQILVEEHDRFYLKITWNKSLELKNLPFTCFLSLFSEAFKLSSSDLYLSICFFWSLNIPTTASGDDEILVFVRNSNATKYRVSLSFY